MQMNTTTLIQKILLTAMTILSCASCAHSREYRSVSADEFEKIISDTSVVVIDVRTEEEYLSGHIPGTKFNFDVLEPGFLDNVKAHEELDGKTVAVYCRSGRRSKEAADILSGSGYKIVELDSGFNGWVSAGKPVCTAR